MGRRKIKRKVGGKVGRGKRKRRVRGKWVGGKEREGSEVSG